MKTTKLRARLDTTGLPSKHTVSLLQSEARALLDRLDKLEAVAEAAKDLVEVELESHYGDSNEYVRFDQALAALEKTGKERA